jgi:myosin heavy subunit
MSAYVADMSYLPEMTLETIMANLIAGFREKKIYTNCGEIVCALNPNEELDIYGDDVMNLYRGAQQESAQPHVYSTVALSMRQLVESRRSQMILVSGESGSGKTESSKYILKMMTSSHRGNIVSTNQTTAGSLEDRILESSPVLEAFGNARTARNHNSSRFGKLTKVFFNGVTGRLVGAALECYLLEKPRITNISETDSNYHV